jgi:hypothetical protein
MRDPLALLAKSARLGPLQPKVLALRSLVNRRAADRTIRELFDLTADAELPGRARGRYLYLPWVSEHGDALLRSLDPDGTLTCPWPLFRASGSPRGRGKTNEFAREHPDLYRRLLLRGLAPVRDSVAGMVFTLDWAPAMRQAVYACRELGIPTVLVPHEGVFASRARYYVDPFSGADIPLCDLVLCWGALQEEIFSERGYPKERIRPMGSPKLDRAAHFVPRLDEKLFASIYGLTHTLPIVLFAMQPPDSQQDPRRVVAVQNQIAQDLLELCGELGGQLLVRQPPSGHDMLSADLHARLDGCSYAAIDAWPYTTGAAESIHHARAVVSINSTMLLEAGLMRRAPISALYLDVESNWSEAGIPSARNACELKTLLEQAFTAQRGLSEQGLAFAAQKFSSGSFDGQSMERIRAALAEAAKDPSYARSPESSYAHLFTDKLTHTSDATAAFHRVPTPAMAHVEAMLGFRRMLHAPSLSEASVADVFVKWGASSTSAKDTQDALARKLHRPQLIVEDGLLRSMELGLSGAPGLSIILDTKTAYYDATRPSRLEDRLNSQSELTPAQLERAQHCIAQLCAARLSKYNHAPDTRHRYANGPCVLVVDQRFGDQSVPFALADESSFARMLEDALKERPDHTIVVKRHPDATLGGKQSYFSNERLAAHRANPRLVMVEHEVNPHTLFDQVDEVWVVSSGMGMEALLRGLPVRCYGAPFYAGWGLTHDLREVPRRRRTRSALELFHFAYIESSRYYSPATGRAAELEDVITHLSQRKQAWVGEAAPHNLGGRG